MHLKFWRSRHHRCPPDGGVLIFRRMNKNQTMETIHILCNDTSKNCDLTFQSSETVGDLKQKLGNEFLDAKWVYAGKFLTDDMELSQILRKVLLNII